MFHNIWLRQTKVKEQKRKLQQFFPFVQEHNCRMVKSDTTKMQT